MPRPAKKVSAPKDATAIRGIKTDFGPEHADTFCNVQHCDLCADYVLANGATASCFGCKEGLFSL